MRWSVLLIATAALGGCADKAVEMKFLVADTAVDLDVSCIDNVAVVIDTAESYTEDCIPVSGATSMADVQQQVRNKFEHAMPNEIVAIEIVGLTGSTPGLCGTGAVVFYGAEAYTGDNMNILMQGTMSCKAMNVPGQHVVRPIDFMALVDTPAGMPPVCKTPTGIIDLAIGTIRPTNLALPNYWTSRMDWGTYGDVDATTGLATLPGWGEPEQTSCLATASDALFAASCIYPNTPSPCGAAGEVVVPIVRDTVSFDSVDQSLFADFPVLVLGAVYDTVTKQPVVGATIAMDPARGRIVYANRGAGNRFDAKTDVSATAVGGLFIAYMREPSVITVTEGTSKKVMRIGGETDLGGAVIVPLR